ncbi:MAG: hypothetical protein HY906_21150 [Deltaproteobacteria bacterium]|nr:hypothetical protein [Deltaproteobacteria bacterium]
MQHALVGVVALATACVGAFAGCGSRPPVVRAAPAPPGPDVSGTWDWDVEERNDEGDTRVEREVWHLTQKGREIQGYYDRVLTVLSGDGRPFECYQDTRYQKFTRFRIMGSIEGAMVRLRETSYETRPDPCDGGRRSMTVYVGHLEGGTITLRWPPAGQQVLRRRGEGAAGPPPADTTASLTRAAPLPAASVGGLWLWEWRTIDANGDERAAREEWHLRQREGRVRGVMDRTVRVVSGSGAAFPCSGKPEQTVVMRYQVSGQVSGRRLEITEVAHSQLAGAPCRLDAAPLASHEGEIGVEEMVLSSARAAGERHVLRRIRPEAGAPK